MGPDDAALGGAMTELILMLSIPPVVGVLAYIAVRWRWARQERARLAVHREPKLN